MEPGFNNDDDAEHRDAVAAEAAVKRKGGWPKGKPRNPRTEPDVRTEAARSTPRRQRTIRGGAVQDKFYVPPELIPAGMSWEWKRVATYGASDPSYDVFVRGQGWEPVDAHQVSSMVPDGHVGAVIRDGLMLMERPIELTKEAHDEDVARAKGVVQAKEQQLYDTPQGQFARKTATGEAAVQITRTVERGGLEID